MWRDLSTVIGCHSAVLMSSQGSISLAVSHLYAVVRSRSHDVQLLLLSPAAFSASAVFLQVLVGLADQFLLKAVDQQWEMR